MKRLIPVIPPLHSTRLMTIIAGVLVAVAVPGCGPSVSRDELGQVIFEVPTLPEQDEYTLPDLAPGAPRTIETPPPDPPDSATQS